MSCIHGTPDILRCDICHFERAVRPRPDFDEVVRRMYLPKIREELDYVLNGGGFLRPRREIIDIFSLSDEQVEAIWTEFMAIQERANH